MKDQTLFICQSNASHVWGEMPFIQKCCECSGELVQYTLQSRLDEAEKLLEEAYQLFDVYTFSRTDMQNCWLQKYIAFKGEK